MNLASKPKPAQNSRVYIWLPLEAPSDKRRGESYSRNPKPETRNPKAETRNPKLETTLHHPKKSGIVTPENALGYCGVTNRFTAYIYL